jgi:hypothetical protein
VEKYEGALGKGKGKHLYAYRMMMAKVGVCGLRNSQLWESWTHEDMGTTTSPWQLDS